MREINIRVQDEFARISDDFAGVQGAGNVTAVVIEFDQSWKEYPKTALWLSAIGESLTRVRLTPENRLNTEGEAYRILVPSEALKESGQCSLMIEGGIEGALARSVQVFLEVAPAFDTEGAQDPQALTPSEADQLSAALDTLNTKMNELNAIGRIIGARLEREE